MPVVRGLACGEGACLWRGGLPPLGCVAAPEPNATFCQICRILRFAAAAHPNGGKPPRHKNRAKQGIR
ncbi:hypothetical protein FQ192_23055 [Pseudomonas sp. ANT_J12]|nr:hypothetical protein FQ192_23055 [Pseudomonas sp. ANT_J12]